MDKKILNRIYNEIEIISETPPEVKLGDNVFDYVEQFLKINEPNNYPEIIYKLSQNIPAQKIATFLNICVWSTKDNGSKQAEETKIWLYSRDKLKIEIVLFLEYLTEKDLNKFKKRIEEIRIQFPSLEPNCKYWSEELKKMIERDKIRTSFWNRLRRWISVE